MSAAPDADVELHRDHPGRLVDDVLEVGARLQLGGERSRRRVRLQHEHGLGDDVRGDQRVGVLVVGECARPVAVEIQRSESDGSDSEREAEHGADAGADRGAAERGPSDGSGIGEIGFEHGPVLLGRVDTGPLPERVLELLDEITHRVGRAHRPARQVA